MPASSVPRCLEELLLYRAFSCSKAKQTIFKTQFGFPVETRGGTKSQNRHMFPVNAFYISSLPLLHEEIGIRFRIRFSFRATKGPMVQYFFNHPGVLSANRARVSINGRIPRGFAWPFDSAPSAKHPAGATLHQINSWRSDGL